ncbi:hypothetical protein N7638_23650 [Achromobacter mucicolens]|uniref:hypothetical protein n=1 Tax=Achromobacter mucicolens TaxID=1389922 RepID=UPI001466E7F4|nr:hypothetical protein [Achromobacter mucicolens]MDG9971047.1 hypothetical protein [Achromobacter mucicolens]CAB3905650.1 hypothetical protein LMG26684_04835 [Achromobacter mucicolens]
MKIVVIAPSPLGEIVESALHPMGYEVSREQAKSLLSSLLAETPADLLVIGEKEGARGSGVRLCKLVRENPRWARTSIFLLCSDESDFEVSKKGGAVDRCFTSPFSPLELLDAVRQEDNRND